MTHVLAPVAALLASAAFLLMGNGLQGTLLPVRAHMEAFSTVEIGILGSAYFIGFAAGCLGGPHLVQRAGHIRAFLAMSAVASTVPLVHALVLDPWSWTLMRGLTGFCLAVLYIVIESWLNERATNETRGVVLSVYQIVQLTVITIGQLMTALYDPAGFELFLLASVLVSMAALPVGFTGASSPAPVQQVRVRVARLYHQSPVGFVGCLTVGLANGAFWALGPYYAQQAGMSVQGIALYMSATVLGGAISQWPLGRLSDRMDRRRIIAGVCFGGGVIGLLLGLSYHEGPMVLWLLGACFGFFAFPLYALALAHTNDHVSVEEFVEASSGLLLVFAVGAVVGPVVASIVIELSGPATLYGYTAACHFAMGGYALWRMRARPPVPEPERGSFAEAFEAAQTVSAEFEVAALRAVTGQEVDRDEAAGR